MSHECTDAQGGANIGGPGESTAREGHTNGSKSTLPQQALEGEDAAQIRPAEAPDSRDPIVRTTKVAAHHLWLLASELAALTKSAELPGEAERRERLQERLPVVTAAVSELLDSADLGVRIAEGAENDQAAPK